MRTALLLAVLAAASGCTSTRVVEATDPEGVSAARRALVGRTAVVELASGAREGGRVVFVRSDSTAWDAGGARRTAPTVDVISIEAPRRGVGRAALVGAGIGAAVALPVAALDIEGDLSGGTGIVGGLAVPFGAAVGAALGAATGAVVGRPVRFVWGHSLLSSTEGRPR